MEKETIQFAAVLRTDQCIVFGRDHAECIKKSPYDTCKKGSIMGFLTNHKRFVSRQEAASIAFKAGQINEYEEGQTILSEEFWSPTCFGKFDYDPINGYVKRNT